MSGPPTKTFGVAARFTLPDDFAGGVPAALRLMADYLESPERTALAGKTPPASDARIIAWDQDFERWLEVAADGGRLTGNFGIDFLQQTPDGLEWVRQPHGCINVRGVDDRG